MGTNIFKLEYLWGRDTCSVDQFQNYREILDNGPHFAVLWASKKSKCLLASGGLRPWSPDQKSPDPRYSLAQSSRHPPSRIPGSARDTVAYFLAHPVRRLTGLTLDEQRAKRTCSGLQWWPSLEWQCCSRTCESNSWIEHCIATAMSEALLHGHPQYDWQMDELRTARKTMLQNIHVINVRKEIFLKR